MADVQAPAKLDSLYTVRPEDYGPEYRDHLLKQYRLAVERADAVSERRATTNEFFLVLVSVVLSIEGVGIGGTFVGTPVIPPKIAPWIGLIGVITSLSWLLSIYASNRLNRAKFYVINRLEERLPAAVFTVEWRVRTTGSEVATSQPIGRLYTSSTIVESIVPASLLLLFVGLSLYFLL
jgi:hypothetical protein